MARDDSGWDWFSAEPNGQAPVRDTEMDELTRAFARCLSGPNGRKVLAHLRSLTAERLLGTTASDAALWHLEGQRHLFAYIKALAERGRGNPQLTGSHDA